MHQPNFSSLREIIYSSEPLEFQGHLLPTSALTLTDCLWPKAVSTPACSLARHYEVRLASGKSPDLEITLRGIRRWLFRSHKMNANRQQVVDFLLRIESTNGIQVENGAS